MHRLLTMTAAALAPALAAAQTADHQTVPSTAQAISEHPGGGAAYGPPEPSTEPAPAPAASNAKNAVPGSDATSDPKHRGHRRGGYVGVQGGGVLGH